MRRGAAVGFLKSESRFPGKLLVLVTWRLKPPPPKEKCPEFLRCGKRSGEVKTSGYGEGVVEAGDGDQDGDEYG